MKKYFYRLLFIFIYIQDLIAQLVDKEEDLKEVEALNDELVKEPGVDSTNIGDNIANLKNKHGKAKEKVADKKDKLVEYIIIIEEYVIIIEEIIEFVVIVKGKPSLNEPIATDPETLKEQLKEAEVGL